MNLISARAFVIVLEDLSSFLKMKICWAFNILRIIRDRNADTAYNGKLYFSIITHSWLKRAQRFEPYPDHIHVRLMTKYKLHAIYTEKTSDKSRKA